MYFYNRMVTLIVMSPITSSEQLSAEISSSTIEYFDISVVVLLVPYQIHLLPLNYPPASLPGPDQFHLVSRVLL